jgi:hypothetical protein
MLEETKNGKDKDIPSNPYKEAEFLAFIELIKGSATCHWVQIAKVLGVDKDTINVWKKHPLARKAIKDGIESALDGMLEAGKGDWRMHESRLKMMGISPIEKSEQELDVTGLPTPIYGGKSKV